MNLSDTKNKKPATAKDLQVLLNAMENAGASIADRMNVAAEFFQASDRDSAFDCSSSDPNPEDEELTFEDDPHISEQDADTSGSHAGQSGPDAGRSGSTSEPQANASEPEPEPQLPAPPKFQFGPGNPCYEIALDFRAHRDKRSVLDHLSDNQRSAIIKLLEDYSEDDVAELLAKAPPAGLNIRVSGSSVGRFRSRYQKQARQRKQNRVPTGM